MKRYPIFYEKQRIHIFLPVQPIKVGRDQLLTNIIKYDFIGLQCFKGLYLKDSNELEAIYNLSESHSPGLRFKTLLHYERLQSKEMEINKITPLLSSKEALMMKCPLLPVENKISEMLNHIEEMPEGIMKMHAIDFLVIQNVSKLEKLDKSFDHTL